jgi:hypothetical protein
MPMAFQNNPVSRVGRAAARERNRKRAAREERLRTQVQTWCNPLQKEVAAQSLSVQEISRENHGKIVDLMVASKTAIDRITSLENNLEKLIKDEVESVMARRFNKEASNLSTVERQIIHLSEGLAHLREKVLASQEAHKQAVTDLQESAARSRKDIDYNATRLAESSNTLDKLVSEFDIYCRNDEQQKNYIQRLEMLCKDLEARVWPWRPNMDRSKSPPPREDELVVWQPSNAVGERAEWMPWPANKEVKAGRPMSPGRTPPCSVQPTPPSSRPSSARYRGREPTATTTARHGSLKSDSKPVGSATAVAKVARPSSAPSHRTT